MYIYTGHVHNCVNNNIVINKLIREVLFQFFPIRLVTHICGYILTHKRFVILLWKVIRKRVAIRCVRLTQFEQH